MYKKSKAKLQHIHIYRKDLIQQSLKWKKIVSFTQIRYVIWTESVLYFGVKKSIFTFDRKIFLKFNYDDFVTIISRRDNFFLFASLYSIYIRLYISCVRVCAYVRVCAIFFFFRRSRWCDCQRATEGTKCMRGKRR